MDHIPTIHLNLRLKYFNFRFLERNGRHVGILIPISILSWLIWVARDFVQAYQTLSTAKMCRNNHFQMEATGSQTYFRFLANVNSRSRSLYVVANPSVVCRLSVVCLSVTFVHPTQPVEFFGNVSTPFGTFAIQLLARKILRRSSQGNPSIGGVKRKRGIQI